MASNVGRIRRILETTKPVPNTSLIEYYKYRFWNENELAVVKLKDAFWFEFYKISIQVSSDQMRLHDYEKLKNKFKTPFERETIEFPEWDGKNRY